MSKQNESETDSNRTKSKNEPESIIDNAAISVPQTTSPAIKPDNPQTPGEQALGIIQALKDAEPEQARMMVDGAMRVIQGTDKKLMLARADIERRKQGMWIGAGLGTISVAGGVIILVGSAPAAIGVGLLALGAVCYGATFAIATGKTVSMEDFSNAFNSIIKTYPSTSKERDEGGNEVE